MIFQMMSFEIIDGRAQSVQDRARAFSSDAATSKDSLSCLSAEGLMSLARIKAA